MAEESKQGQQSKQGQEIKPGQPEGKGGDVVRAVPARAITPFDEMERMMDRMFADFFPRSLLQPLGWRGTRAEWEPQVPRVDVLDRDDQVIVRAELPGVQKKDLDVAVRDSTVNIKATVEREEKEDEGDYYRRELQRGSFSRTITLPTEVDSAKAKATFKDGILELTLPKTEQARGRHIPIE